MSDTLEKGCKWFFAPRVNYNVGPTDAAGQNFRGAWDSLIRECIQNSLDAVKDSNQPVIVRLDFKNMPMRSYTNFFEIKTHIESCLNTFPETAKAKYKPMLDLFNKIMGGDNQMPYLQVSDYNTKGMAYDENNDSCNFSAFVRGLGVHGGDQTAYGRGGSFGLGKSTIFTMSPIRTMMVSTYTSEGQYVFEGVSSLTTHRMGNEKLSHIGYYDNHDGYPVTDAEFIPARFIRKPDENGETRSGTDIFIMGRKLEDGDMDSIKRQVLIHYWLSIYKGKLIVELAEANTIKEIISKDKLQEMMEVTFPSRIDNARNSINPRPYYDAVVNADILPICKHVSKKLLMLGDVELFLIKNKEAQKDRLTFFRLPCMMIMRKSTSQFNLRINNYGVYGVFVCLNNCGDRLLKHLENPAHDEWNEKNWTNSINNHIEPQAGLVMDELREFIAAEIETFCKTKGQNSLKMIGAGKYLYTVQDVVDNSEDDIESSGNAYIAGSNISQEETGIRSSEFSDNYRCNVPDSLVGSRPGNITDKYGNAKADSTDENNRQLHVKVQNPTNNRNKTNRKNKGGDTIKKASPSDRLAEIVVPINFKVYACEENGHIIHNICITTEQDVKSALIQISSKGEDGKVDDELEIINSFGSGLCKGMELRNVYLNNGNNILKVQFSDNMKHSLYINVKSQNLI